VVGRVAVLTRPRRSGARTRKASASRARRRSVALPEGTADVEARAHYANGVLEVHVEKREQSKPRQIPVTTTIEGASTD
jgi:HSP20 family molecular chaperone IbpA